MNFQLCRLSDNFTVQAWRLSIFPFLDTITFNTQAQSHIELKLDLDGVSWAFEDHFSQSAYKRFSTDYS